MSNVMVAVIEAGLWVVLKWACLLWGGYVLGMFLAALYITGLIRWAADDLEVNGKLFYICLGAAFFPIAVPLFTILTVGEWLIVTGKRQ